MACGNMSFGPAWAKLEGGPRHDERAAAYLAQGSQEGGVTIRGGPGDVVGPLPVTKREVIDSDRQPRGVAGRKDRSDGPGHHASTGTSIFGRSARKSVSRVHDGVSGEAEASTATLKLMPGMSLIRAGRST